MNKKLLAFGIIGLFAVSLVAAIGYYAVFSASFNVMPSIVVEGDMEQSLGDVSAGDSIVGSQIEVTNEANTERQITISDNSDEDVSVSYKSSATLSQKVVDFNLDVWELTGDTATLEYTLVGDTFYAEVTEGEKEGYVLVYYKDNSDRFNSPATAVGVDSVVGNLPYEDDKNADEYDYCETGEYVTCHGAKIWYLPEASVDLEGNVDWNQASLTLFETELVQYNSEGNIVVYPNQTLVITPVYEIGDFASGEYTIETTVA